MQEFLHNKKWIVFGIVIFSSIFIVMHAFFWFQATSRNQTAEYNMERVTDMVILESKQIEKNFRASQTLVQYIAYNAEVVTEYYEWDWDRIVNRLDSNNIFDSLSIVTAEGDSYSRGRKIQVSQEPFFETGMSGESGMVYIEHFPMTNRRALAMYAPINIDGKIVGFVLGAYYEKTLESLFTIDKERGAVRTYLIDSSGTVLADYDESFQYTNIFEKLKTTLFYGDADYQDLVDFAAGTEHETMAFQYEGYMGRAIAAIARLPGSEWMIMQVLPASVTKERVREINQTALILEIVLLLAFVLYIAGIFSYSIIERKRISDYNNQLQELLANERERHEIIGALSRLYYSVFAINLEKDQYLKIFAPESFEPCLNESQSASKMVESWAQMFKNEESAQQIRSFFDRSTMGRRLRRTDFVSLELVMEGFGWIRTRLVVSQRGTGGTPTHLLWCCQDISDEKEQQLKATGTIMDTQQIGNILEHDSDILMPSFDGRKVLIAEDHGTNTDTAAILEKMGLHVEQAGDGKEALDKFKESAQGHYSLILMDIEMPVMNGYESAKGIRESSHADAKTVPMIALSVHASEEDIRKALESGMNEHLEKPLDIKALTDVLYKYL